MLPLYRPSRGEAVRIVALSMDSCDEPRAAHTHSESRLTREDEVISFEWVDVVEVVSSARVRHGWHTTEDEMLLVFCLDLCAHWRQCELVRAF